MKKKVLFTVNYHSTVDIITNSSSELFITKRKDNKVESFIKWFKPLLFTAFVEETNRVLNENFHGEDNWDRDYVLHSRTYGDFYSVLKTKKEYYLSLLDKEGLWNAFLSEYNIRIYEEIPVDYNDDSHWDEDSFVTDYNADWGFNITDGTIIIESVQDNPDYAMQLVLMSFGFEKHHLG